MVYNILPVHSWHFAMDKKYSSGKQGRSYSNYYINTNEFGKQAGWRNFNNNSCTKSMQIKRGPQEFDSWFSIISHLQSTMGENPRWPMKIAVV